MENIERYRENGVIDVSRIISEENQSIDLEQRGTRCKFWFSDYKYLFKSNFGASYEDYAEVIAEGIAKYFGMPCAEYDFATYNGEIGVVTKNFVNEAEGEELISGTEIINYVMKNHVELIEFACKSHEQSSHPEKETSSDEEKKKYIEKMLNLLKDCDIDYQYASEVQRTIDDSSAPNYTSKLDEMISVIDEVYETLNDTYSDLFQRKSQKKFNMQANNLFDLWSIIDIYIKKQGLGDEKTVIELNNALYDIFIFDILTIQGDRHPANWGLIINKDKKTVRMTPIFDNANIYNLNRSKVISQIDSTIKVISQEKPSPKKDRIQKNLESNVYHPMPRLGIDEERRNDYLKQVVAFAKDYSASDLEALEKKLIALDDNTISFIFSEIQSNTKREIPDIVKNVVSESIKINRNNLLSIINNSKGERSVNQSDAKH